MAIDVEKYRERLLEEQGRLTQNLDTVADATNPATDDRVMTAAHVQYTAETTDVAARMVELRSDRREKVDAALQRIDDGTYGTCERCGKEIDAKRLDAEPTALTCIECASREEGDVDTATM